MKNDTRPINVGISDLMIFKFPITAISSITHRIAGVALFVGIAFILYALELSLGSEAGFEEIKMMMVSPFGKIVTWGILSALAFHFVAGIKHLMMDLGIGETLEGGIAAARLVFVLSAILIALAGVWVFQP